MPLWILGRLSAGKRYSFFRLPAYVVIRRYYILFLYFHVITDDFKGSVPAEGEMTP